MDKHTFKICEATALGLTHYYMGPNDKRELTASGIERVNKKRKRTKDTYTPEAYEAHKAQCRENARKRAHDPKVIEAHRKTSHEWYEAHKHDPEFIKRSKENQARYRAKVAADHVKNAARKEYMHDYCAKRYAAQKQMEAESLESWK